MRPILRPGTHLLRRDGDVTQIGLDPSRAVVLPMAAAVVGRLTSADTGPASDADRHTLDLLAEHDLLLDSDRLLPLIPLQSPSTGRSPSRRATPAAAASRPDVAALARVAGDDAADLLDLRRRTRLELHGFGHESGGSLVDDLERLLTRAGVGVARSARGRKQDATLGVLVGVGEPHRVVTDPWLRDGVPHLVVRLSEGHATVGPFVAPGRTACLRCVDAHHTDADSSWPLLVEQYARLSGQDRVDGIPEPVDSLLAAVAVSWAARDLASYAEGRRPSTWSTTIRFDPHLTSVETRSWLRHPECGCSWA
jgi:bacteriocin biosynthesis cyclodehydratase domain-containing protein